MAQVLHRVQVEVDLIRNAEPHMGLCPPRHTLSVEVVVHIDIVHRAVAAAGSAAEGEGGHHVVVNATQRPDGSRRIHNDPSRVDDLAELPDDLFVARENDRSMSQSAGMVHVYAHLERLIDRFRAVNREHWEQLLDRQRMFPADTLNWSNQELGAWLDRQTDHP